MQDNLTKNNNGRFQKGLAPWNKGMKGKQPWHNISGFQEGHGWNKGQKFPEFSGENHPNWKGGLKDLCKCGKEKVRISETCMQCSLLKRSGENAYQYKGGKPKCQDCGETTTQYSSKRCVECHRKTMIGETSPNYRGGITPLRQAIMSIWQYKNWRTGVFLRDDYTCQHCGGYGGTLHADHKKSFALIVRENKIDSIQSALNCKELWDIENGQTLCLECHKKTDTYLKALKYIK